MTGSDDSHIRRLPLDADEVDEASDESFPASDPPGWEPLRVGSPRAIPDQPRGAPDTPPDARP